MSNLHLLQQSVKIYSSFLGKRVYKLLEYCHQYPSWIICVLAKSILHQWPNSLLWQNFLVISPEAYIFSLFLERVSWALDNILYPVCIQPLQQTLHLEITMGARCSSQWNIHFGREGKEVKEKKRAFNHSKGGLRVYFGFSFPKHQQWFDGKSLSLE